MFERQPGAWVRLIDKVYLLHGISLSRLILLSNAYKPAQTVKENEAIEYVPTKEQDKPPETKVNETEIRYLSSGEFKIVVIKMLTRKNNT